MREENNDMNKGKKLLKHTNQNFNLCYFYYCVIINFKLCIKINIFSNCLTSFFLKFFFSFKERKKDVLNTEGKNYTSKYIIQNFPYIWMTVLMIMNIILYLYNSIVEVSIF